MSDVPVHPGIWRTHDTTKNLLTDEMTRHEHTTSENGDFLPPSMVPLTAARFIRSMHRGRATTAHRELTKASNESAWMPGTIGLEGPIAASGDVSLIPLSITIRVLSYHTHSLSQPDRQQWQVVSR